jgi:hypothetical protein
MAADQKNFALFTYVDNDGISWNKRGEVNSARQAIDGNAAPGAHPNWGRSTRRHKARSITYVDGTTFRKVEVVFYTAAAFAAVVKGTDTIAVHVEGESATVAYTASKKNDEKSASATSGPQLADHA